MPFSDEKLTDMSLCSNLLIRILLQMAKTFEGNIWVFVVSLVEFNFSNYKVLILISKKKNICILWNCLLKKLQKQLLCPWITIYSPNFLRGEKREVHLVQWPKEVNHFNKYFQFHQTAQGTFKEHLRKTWWTNIPTFSNHDCKPFQLTQQSRNARVSDLKRLVYSTNKPLSNSPNLGELNQTSKNSVGIY